MRRAHAGAWLDSTGPPEHAPDGAAAARAWRTGRSNSSPTGGRARRPTLIRRGLPSMRPMGRLPRGPGELDDPIRHRRAVAQGGRHPTRARGRAPLSARRRRRLRRPHRRGQAPHAGMQVRRRWKAAYAPFFPPETDRANAAFLEVEARRLELWIRGVTPEPFGLQATTLERDASGVWRLSADDPRRGALTRIEIFGVLASRLGLIGVAIDHLDGPDDENLAAIAGLECRQGKGFPSDRLRPRPPRVHDPGRPSIGAISGSAARRSCK